MEKYKKGSIIYIGGLDDNVNPETGEKKFADFGLVIESDDVYAYYLAIKKIHPEFEAGRYINLFNGFERKHSKYVEGFIDLKYVYSTSSNQDVVAMIYNENIMNDIMKRRIEYLDNDKLYKPFIRVR